MSAASTAAQLVTFPIGAAIIGAGVAAWHPPGGRVTSGVQHFAAGVVFAAVAGEVLPDLRDQHAPWFLTVGFLVGVALLLVLRTLSNRMETTGRAFPVGLLVLVAVDLLIDGLLVGVGAALGEGQARILIIALTLEVLFLGLSLVIQLSKSGLGTPAAVAVTAATSLAIAVGAVGGAVVLSGASHNLLAAVLAFGAAALLYLVTEELLVEAHESAETGMLTALFFLGFLAVFILEG